PPFVRGRQTRRRTIHGHQELSESAAFGRCADRRDPRIVSLHAIARRPDPQPIAAYVQRLAHRSQDGSFVLLRGERLHFAADSAVEVRGRVALSIEAMLVKVRSLTGVESCRAESSADRRRVLPNRVERAKATSRAHRSPRVAAPFYLGLMKAPP